MEPVTSVITQNTTPTSAEAAASRSQRRLRVRGHKYARLASAHSPKPT
jgi:hypothetical protein